MLGTGLLIANKVQTSVLVTGNKTEPDILENQEDLYNNSAVNNSNPLNDDEYIFDRTDIRAIFIALYTIVFCCCFFGECFYIFI